MSDTETKELQVKEKQEAPPGAEQTRPGPVFTPDVDIFESDYEITLLADMPGVKPEDLNIDLRDNTLTLIGETEEADFKEEEAISMEYEAGKYFRKFTLSEVIDQSGIDATLNDGVLRLILPKVEKVAPRKIEVKAA